MYSDSEVRDQREKMLVAQISYLREEKRLQEMTILDIKTRNNVVSDIIKRIAQCGREIGGWHDEAWQPTRSFCGVCGTVSSEGGGC